MRYLLGNSSKSSLEETTNKIELEKFELITLKFFQCTILDNNSLFLAEFS